MKRGIITVAVLIILVLSSINVEAKNLNLVVSLEWPTDKDYVTSYEYDGNGLLIKRVDNGTYPYVNSETIYDRDSKGRIKTVTTTDIKDDGQYTKHILRYKYNDKKRTLTIKGKDETSTYSYAKDRSKVSYKHVDNKTKQVMLKTSYTLKDGVVTYKTGKSYNKRGICYNKYKEWYTYDENGYVIKIRTLSINPNDKDSTWSEHEKFYKYETDGDNLIISRASRWTYDVDLDDDPDYETGWTKEPKYEKDTRIQHIKTFDVPDKFVNIAKCSMTGLEPMMPGGEEVYY